MTPRVESGTYDEAVAQVAGMAKEAFATHELWGLGRDEWNCQRASGSSIYAFHVISRPGYLIVFGDIGDWVLQASERNMVYWAMGAVRSPSYFCEKIRAGERLAFYSGEARAIVEEGLKGNEDMGLTKEQAEKVNDAISSWDELDQREWYEACIDAGDDEPALCEYPSPRALWLIEAMKWFCAQIAERDRLADEDAALAAAGAA